MKRYLAGVLAVIFPSASWAVGSGAFTNQTVGAKALGMGNAFTAVADDPSAVFFNPAGMTQLEGAQLSLGATMLAPTTKYEAPDGTSDKTHALAAVVPNLYFTRKYEAWSFGVGINAPYGLETHWDKFGPLRYTATDSRLTLVDVTPSAAYALNERLSVGAGVVYGRVESRSSSAYPSSALISPGLPDGSVTLQGDGDGWGGTAGILWVPLEGHSVGLSYRSPIRTRLQGDMSISVPTLGTVLAQPIETRITFPASWTAGYARRTNAWTFAADVEWTGYSSINENRIEDGNTGAVVRVLERDWRNTLNVGLGMERKIGDRTAVRAGYYYYSSVVPERNWEPGTPDAMTHGLCLGYGRAFSPSVRVDVGYNRLLLVSREIRNAVTADGKYKTGVDVLFVNFGFKWH